MPFAFDIKITLFVFASSLLGIVSSISALQNQGIESSVGAPSLKIGTQIFELRSGTTCFGTLTAKLAVEGEPELRLNATFRAHNASEKIDVAARSSLAFNALGQLIASESRVDIRDQEIKIQTRNVRPIRATITFPAEYNTAVPPIELPGPLSLTKKGDLFFITHPLSDSASNPYATAWMGALLKDFNLSVKAPVTGEVAAECQTDRIDVAQMSQSFSSVLHFLK